MNSVFVRCEIAATFVSKDQDVFNITQQDIGKVVEAPEWVVKTLMFEYLLSQSYITIVDGPEEPVEEVKKAPVVEIVPELPKEAKPKEEPEKEPEKEAKPQKSPKKKMSGLDAEY